MPTRLRSVALTTVALMTLGAALSGCDEDEAEQTEARIFFVSPEDGATVSSPVSVQMGSEHFAVEPAGEVHAGHGHFHIVVDSGCVTPGETIPSDDAHVHYGGGQTEVELELEPGSHHLCLQAGDGEHLALDLTEEIDITVSE